jgi:ubiquinone/menaquinone biosynthesis C-methylase UbiE
MTEEIDAVAADRALKTKHRKMWATGNYSAVATELIPDLGQHLVRACGVSGGQRVLDIAAGSGNAAIPAALAGASVVACDLTPELLEDGRKLAAERGAELEWREADAESLPFADNEFDTVMSCVGIMFAPHHAQSAAEMIRVCRPGGTVGLLNWTPEGFIGQMFATMKPYAPKAPPGAQAPPLWGLEDHVRGLLGDRVADVDARRRTVRVDRFGEPKDFREYFKVNYGPTIATYRNIADAPDQVAALNSDLDGLAQRFSGGADTVAMDWEYLLLTARKRGSGVL